MEDPMADEKPLTKDEAEAFNKFKDCAVEVLHVPPKKVTRNANFAKDLDADSLDLVELVMALEEQFGITVDESELDGVETVGEAFDLVFSKL
jgi:acyl carrier protein